MNKKDWLISIVFAVTLLILIFPWKVEFEDRNWGQVYYTILSLGITLPIVYGIWRSISKFGKRKLANLISLTGGILIAVFIISANSFLEPPHLISYMPLYSNPNNQNETIEIVHNHRFMKGWNGMKLIKNYPTFGISLRKMFEQKQLNGNWIISDGNPYFEFTGKAMFKDGEVLNKN